MSRFFEPAARLGLIPPYLFKTIDDKKAEVKARGVDIIDLGVGDPDLPTPALHRREDGRGDAGPRKPTAIRPTPA